MCVRVCVWTFRDGQGVCGWVGGEGREQDAGPRRPCGMSQSLLQLLVASCPHAASASTSPSTHSPCDPPPAPPLPPLQSILRHQYGLHTTIRQEMGQDISGAWGWGKAGWGRAGRGRAG